LTTGANFFFANGEYDLEGPGANGTFETGTSDYAEHGFELGAGYKVADATTVSSAVSYQNFDVDGEFVEGPSDTFIGGNEGGNFFTFKLGVEQALDDMFSLRAGYKYLGRQTYFFGREDIRDFNGSAKTNAWTAGLGVAIPTGMHYFPTVNLDYAAEYRDIAYGDWQQTVTLSFPFNLCEPS
jgi:predicted porin